MRVGRLFASEISQHRRRPDSVSWGGSTVSEDAGRVMAAHGTRGAGDPYLVDSFHISNERHVLGTMVPIEGVDHQDPSSRRIQDVDGDIYVLLVEDQTQELAGLQIEGIGMDDSRRQSLR